MYAGKLVFAQLMDHLPWHRFRRCVERYDGNHKVKSFSCSDQYRCMAFAQLTYRSCGMSRCACGLSRASSTTWGSGAGSRGTRSLDTPTSTP